MLHEYSCRSNECSRHVPCIFHTSSMHITSTAHAAYKHLTITGHASCTQLTGILHASCKQPIRIARILQSSCKHRTRNLQCARARLYTQVTRDSQATCTHRASNLQAAHTQRTSSWHAAFKQLTTFVIFTNLLFGYFWIVIL